MNMIQALNSALDVMMERDGDVVSFGEDAGYFGGVFRVTANLQKKYGLDRSFDAPINEAAIVAMAIGMALEAINGVNPAVTYFGDDGHRPVFSAVRHGERVAPNAGKFTFAPTGTTPMAEALWYSAFELVQTKEERKMLIIVTDGDPDEPEATQAVIDLCTASGVEVIGIGVVSGAIARFVKNHVVIDQVEDLQKTLFRLMEQTLTAELAA